MGFGTCITTFLSEFRAGEVVLFLVRWYEHIMKVKTSVMLSEDILKEIDTFSIQYKSRSEFIEIAVRTFVAQLLRQQQNLRDLEIINRYADDLNEEAMDVLEYQVAL